MAENTTPPADPGVHQIDPRASEGGASASRASVDDGGAAQGEPSDDVDNAIPTGSYTGLTLGQGDVDWFVASVPPGSTVHASITGDVDISQMYGNNDDNLYFGTSGYTNNASTTQQVYLRVRTEEDTCTTYDIDVWVTP